MSAQELEPHVHSARRATLTLSRNHTKTNNKHIARHTTMVQLIPGVTTPLPAARRTDPLTDLTVLLNRLQRTILHADAEREARLRANEFEREKAQAVSTPSLTYMCSLH